VDAGVARSTPARRISMVHNKWFRLIGFLGLLGLAVGVAGCCAVDGSICDVDSNCCSDYCVYDDIADENFCEEP
jgi:hypothetical protein